MTPRQRDMLITRIAAMPKPGLVRLLRKLQCGFEMDFSDDYLDSMSLDRLRHVVLAAALHHHGSQLELDQIDVE